MKVVLGGRFPGTLAVVIVGVVCLIAKPAPGRAQPTTLYESERVARALHERSLVVEEHPEGKRITFIKLVREDVFVDDEFWPSWPNAFHWLTREKIIRREMLVARGERYEQSRINESMRNLRGLDIFALVRIVAVESREPDTVGLVVYTRDLWSLRLEIGLSGAGEGFNLTLPLTERNFLGRNKQMSVRFGLDPKALSIGQVYSDPRVMGGDVALAESFDVILNRDSGNSEGSQGSLAVGEPFRDLSQQWSWNTATSYSVFVARSVLGSDVVSYRPSGGDAKPCDVGDPNPDCMRGVWDDRSYRTSLSGSYRRGERYKQTFTVGGGFSDRFVAANHETNLMAGQEEIFKDLLLPRARRQVYPFVSYGLSLPDFVVFRDLSTFGQSESVRVGPVVSSSVAFPIEAFGSSSDSVKLSGATGYVLAGGDALAELSMSAGARLEDGRVRDQTLSGLLRGATPAWFIGRFVASASWDGRRRDTSRAQATLGGDDGLRGYPAGSFPVVGGSRVRANVEFRSLPLVLESVHLGGVIFYDAGSTYSAMHAAVLHHAIGAGLRLLFPQFNHTPFRADFGVPLDRKGPSVLVMVSYGSQQAVPITSADDASAFGEAR